MKRISWLALVLAALAGSDSRPAAQSRRPDFSGSWKLASASGSGGSPSRLTIVQNDTTLTVTAGEQVRTYNLDGADTEVREVYPNTAATHTSQARWVGSALIIATTTATSSIGTWQDMDVYSLDYGPKLVVVRVVTQTTSPMMATTTGVYERN